MSILDRFSLSGNTALVTREILAGGFPESPGIAFRPRNRYWTYNLPQE